MTSFFPSRTTTATLPSYSSEASLPLTAVAGDVASVLLDNSIWQYTISGWVCIASGQMFSASGTGVLKGGTCTIDGGGASYSISDGFGVYIDYSLTPHTHKIVYWSGLSNIPVNNSRPNTYIAIDKNGALFESGTELTSSNERDYFYLAGYTQVAGTILAIKSAPVLAIAPANQLNDLFRSIGVFKVSGLNFAGIAATLSLSRSSGVLFDRSNNWKNTEKNPHQITISAQSPLQFKRVTQTTINQTNFTTLDVGNYDNAGTVTAIAGSNNQAQNMRLYQFGTGTVYVQYGQQVYSTLANAVAGIASENFNTNPVASQDNAVLVCTISVIKGATDLTNTSQAIFHLAGRFGDQGGGASGGVASVTLQQAYDNSSNPEIQTDSTRGALQVRRGATAATGDVLTIEDQSGTRVAGISDTGALKIGVATGVLHSDASGNITSSQIVDGDVATGASIAGTKISPNFGSQNITTTGTITASGSSLNGFAVNVQTVNATDMYGSLDAANIGGTLSIGTGNAATVNIGTGPGTTTINLGGPNDTVTITGTLTSVNTNNLEVVDKLITLNKGGVASSGGGAGFEIEENGSATGYIKVNTGRTGYQLKPPSTGLVEIVAAAADTTLTATSTVSRSLNLPNVSGTLISTGDTGTVTSTMILDGTIVDADVNASAAISGSKIQSASGSVSGVVTTGTQTLAGAKTFSSAVAVTDATASISSATGALVVTGGVGVGGRANVGGRVVLDDATASTSTNTGALVVTGGVGVGGRANIGGILAVTDGTASTSASTGSVQIGGGVGIAGQMNMTGDLRIGSNRGSDGAAALLFQAVSGAASTTAQVQRASGANGNFNILNTGTGVIDIRNSAGTSTGQGVAIQGYRNGALTAGYVGENVKTYRTSGTGVALTTGNYGDVLSYTLPSAGVWLISGQCYLENTSGGTQPMTAILVQTSAPAESEFESMAIIDVPVGAVRVVALPSRVISTTGTPTFTIRARPSSANTTIGTGGNNYQWISVTRIA